MQYFVHLGQTLRPPEILMHPNCTEFSNRNPLDHLRRQKERELVHLAARPPSIGRFIEL